MRQPLTLAIAVALLVRLALFLYAIHTPLENERRQVVSPVSVQQGLDFQFYNQSRKIIARGAGEIMTRFQSNYHQSFEDWGALVVSSPALPVLLALFDYGSGNTMPLAILYLILGSGLAVAWLVWLDSRGIPWPWLLVFAVVPNPIWFALNISTDLLFAVAFAAFYLVYFRARDGNHNWWWIIGLATVALATRPNAISLVLFIILDAVFNRTNFERKSNILVVASSAALLVPVSVYYFPYLLIFVQASQDITYFGITQTEYASGLFPNVPNFVDSALSWICLFVAKALYFCGLRPSYAETEPLFVIARAAVGVITLPGLVYLFACRDRTHKLLVASFILPVFLGATQDRYNLPIMPILFCFGVAAYRTVWCYLMNKTMRQRRMDDQSP